MSQKFNSKTLNELSSAVDKITEAQEHSRFHEKKSGVSFESTDFKPILKMNRRAGNYSTLLDNDINIK